MIVDLRSDTVTKPTKEMLTAMMSANVGDDVFGEDPVVNELEQKSADLFYMEAGLYCPSGTMANQIALRTHTRPLDEVICDKLSHIYQYETGGYAANSGISVKLIDTETGIMNADLIKANIQPDYDWLPQSSLVVVENTCNKGGGSYYRMEQLSGIRQTCLEHQLKLHLDGARVFNALQASGHTENDYEGLFHSMSVCFSKGLGAPVGSVLLGSEEFIKRARKVRKAFGGGMRQAGYLAAACIYALDNHIDRLSEDHERAAILGKTLEQKSWVEQVMPVQTNIVVFKLTDQFDEATFMKKLEEKGIKTVPFGKQTIRLVTHLDFDDDQLDHTVKVLESI